MTTSIYDLVSSNIEGGVLTVPASSAGEALAYFGREHGINCLATDEDGMTRFTLLRYPARGQEADASWALREAG